MKQSILVTCVSALCLLTSGCGKFFVNETGSGSSPSTIGMQVVAQSPTSQLTDTSATTAYYTYGGFTYNGLSTTPGSSAMQAAGTSGSFYFVPNRAPSSSSPLGIGWAAPADANCPSSRNGQYLYVSKVYTAYSQVAYINCQAAATTAVSQTVLTSNNTPPTLTLYLNYPISTTYGTPRVAVYALDGSLIASDNASLVSSDRLSVSFYSSLVPSPQPYPGDPGDAGPMTMYAVGLASVNQDGSQSSQGGTTIQTMYQPPPPCSNGNCTD